MNVESIAEVKVLTSGYQAEYGRSSGLQITAVTKSGTNRFRGSLYDVERNSDWNSNSKANKLNGDPKPIIEGARLGLLDRRPDRQAGRQQQAVLLLQPGVLAAHRRATTSAATACRPRSSAQGDFSQTTDNLGNLYPFIKDPQRQRRLHARRTQAACFADGGVLGRIPASQLYQTGLNILKHVPAAEHPRSAPGQALQLRDHAADRVDPELAAGAPRRLPADADAPRHRQVLGLAAAQPDHQRHAARLQRHADAAAGRSATWRHASTTRSNPTTFLEATYGRSQNELAGCALAQRHRTDLLHGRRSR